MNLQNVARAAVAGVNPSVPVVVLTSVGFTIAADGTQMPTYTAALAKAQIQALAGTDLERVNNLGLQGVLVAAYMDCQYTGVVRVDGKGGDVFYISGKKYLVVHVLENWTTVDAEGGWSKVVLQLQRDK